MKGSLCTGIGLLDAAVPGEMAWHAEVEPAPAAYLASLNHSTWGNIGDITTFGAGPSTSVEVVDEIVMGAPCQPTSETGPGTGDADPRWLWPHALRVVTAMRPDRVFFENTEGLVTYDGGRLWRKILHDLRMAGYACRWMTLGACMIGAPHHRHRVFLLATNVGHPFAPAAHRLLHHVCRFQHSLNPPVLLPTPRASDGEKGPVSVARTARTGRRNEASSTPFLLAQNPDNPEPARWRKGFNANLLSIMDGWASITGNPIPEPMDFGPRGGRRLSAAFAEWMMGVAPGTITAHPAFSRRSALKALGNGVVTRQAIRARELLLRDA